MANPRIAVVVPVFGRFAQTARFIESFRRVEYDNYEIVIVDDNSPDETAVSLARDYPDVKVLTGDGNLWWTGGTNLGVRYALANGFHYVLTINNDTCVEPDFLNCLVETAEANRPCIVGSRMQLMERPGTVRALGGSTNWTAGDVVGVCEQFVDEADLLARYTNPVPRELLTGCGTLVSTACYRAIGLYDGRMFPHYHSDSEFTLRAAKKGYRVLVDLRAVVHVDESAPPRNRSMFARNSPMYWRPLLAFHLRYCPPQYFFSSLKRQLRRGLDEVLARRKPLSVRSLLRRLRGGPQPQPQAVAPPPPPVAPELPPAAPVEVDITPKREIAMPVDRTAPGTATLWVEVGTQLRWAGKVTGIPRTVSQLLEVLLNKQGLRVRLCVFNSQLEAFEETPLEAIRPSAPPEEIAAPAPPPPPPAPAPAAPPAPPAPSRLRKLRTALRPWVRPFYRIMPSELQCASRAGYHAARHLGRFLLGRGRNLRVKPVPEPVKPVQQLAHEPSRDLPAERPPVRPIFEDSDVVFFPGASWDDQGVCDHLAKLKQKQRLYVVPIVYDLIPENMPQVCSPLLPQLFVPWIRKLLGVSDLVLTISQYSRNDLLAFAERIDMQAPPVEVIQLGDAPTTFCANPTRPRDLPEETRRFALSVGTFEVRKNHLLLYQVWRRLIQDYGDSVPSLVMAGRPGWGTHDVLTQIRSDPVVRGRIHVVFSAMDEELAWLYSNCLFTLYPSQFEGWGLPVAESLARGKHCICSESSSLPEVGGDLVDYHDPLDAMGCMELVRRAVFEPGYLPGREARIREEFRPTSWEACGERIPVILEQTLGVQLFAPAERAVAA